jgi:hypothetical protein
VTYTPEWEPLADALQRVMATGLGEDEAKLDLCRAVADRKIDVRVRIASRGMRGEVFSDGNVDVPAYLKPSDFDWVQSRPLAQWLIGPRPGEHYLWVGGWEKRPLDLIEVSTADVKNVLIGSAGGLAQVGERPQPRPRKKSGPAIERTRRVIDELYPGGVPDQATVPNVSLCNRVGTKLKEARLPAVSDDTILRAAGRRK